MPTDTSFVHLSLHSEYSLVDSVIRIPQLMQRLQQLQMPAIALTDHSNLFAMVKFYRAAERAGIKPIIGAEIQLEPASGNLPARLLLLCQNRQGYTNLCRLVSHAYLHSNSRDQHWVNKQDLFAHNEGLIALSGGLQGDIGQTLLQTGKTERAAQLLQQYQNHFGDRFVLQIARLGHSGEADYERWLIELANHSACPVVACNDVCFLQQEDFTAHEARVCINQGRVLADQRRQQTHTEQQYLRSSEEMAALFSDMPQVLENAALIAQRCNLELQFDQYALPAFPESGDHSEADFLAIKASEGLQQRLQDQGIASDCQEQDYQNRLQLELEVINNMGFPGYFLIVADFVLWAKNNDIPVGPGRGSGAGSVVAWALNITDLDPLRYELLFERFLNPERVSMPDFDIDFCMTDRDRVIDYVANTYGHDQVSQIITFGRMNAKAVVRDCGRVLGYGYGFVDSIAKLIPPDLNMTLDKALHDEPQLQQRRKDEEGVDNVISLALQLEGLARNAGKHAGGVVIAPGPLTDYTALYAEPGGSTVSQLDKDDIEAMGLVKFDFLGLRTLTIIKWALQDIDQRRADEQQPPLDLRKLSLDDAATFKLLQECRTTAVFQLESRGMRDLMRKLQPDCFDDIVALVALFRPGPLDSGMAVQFIERKQGEAEIHYLHPCLETILKPTYGVVIYQEQVMQIAQIMAGYSLGAADLLRRAMGKKQIAEMNRQRDVFVAGAKDNGIEERLANSVYDKMETFAKYGFNKSHSAAYAMLSYQTAWLKAHYPAEFMAAVMSADMDDQDKIANLIDDCRKMGIEILPPDVMRSAYRFVVDDGAIRYGLGAIKGVGEAAIESIITSRPADGEFASLQAFCLQQDLRNVNRRALEALIRAGAMTIPDQHPAQLLADLDAAIKSAEQTQHDRDAGQSGLFADLSATPAASESPAEQTATVAAWSEQERLRGERDTLGLYLTAHPLDCLRDELAQFTSGTLDSIEQRITGQASKAGKQPVVIAALVMAIRRRPGKGAFVAVDDGKARVEINLFEEVYNDCETLLQKDQLVIIKGDASVDRYNGGLRISAREIMDLTTARQRHARYLHLRLHAPDTQLVGQLEQLLRSQSGVAPAANGTGGNVKVIADVSTSHYQARLRFADDWRVAADSQLLEALSALPGVEHDLYYERSEHSH
jgi:DNA polymerase III subunit alpha